jgi:hypothetical protein
MLIDEIIFELKQAKKSIAKRVAAESEERLAAIREQMESLDDLTPRFNVHNIYTKLNPALLNVNTEVANKRDTEATEFRNQVLTLSAKAPMCPPWWTFWMEFRYPKSQQRIGVLLRYDKTFIKYAGSLAFDRMLGSSIARGQHDFLVDAFELLLDPMTEMFGSYHYNVPLVDEHAKHLIPAFAEVARVFVQFKNFYYKDGDSATPLVRQHTAPAPKTSKKNGNGIGIGNSHRNSAETVLLFEPFMRLEKQQSAKGNGTHESPGLHWRSGYVANYTMRNPLGGAISWQTGKPKKLTLGRNYGRIRFAPAKLGDPAKGVRTKRQRVELGSMADPKAKPEIQDDAGHDEQQRGSEKEGKKR